MVRPATDQADQTTYNFGQTVHGDMVNSSVHINLPPRSELQMGTADPTDSVVNGTYKQEDSDPDTD